MPYKNIEDYPFRASMRRSNKNGYIPRYCRNYGSHTSEFFTWLRNFLRYCVGKPFDEMYSILCKRYSYQVGYINPKQEFRNRLNAKSRHRIYSKNYYVDSDGIIKEWIAGVTN